MAQRERRIKIDFPAERGHDFFPVVAVRENAAGWDQAVDGIRDGSDQHSELISTVDVLLFKTENDRTEVFVVGEVVPVFGAVKVLLVSLLLDRGQPELAELLPGLFNRGLFSPGFADSTSRDLHALNQV